jgi:outer membrane protein assembly factor BamB
MKASRARLVTVFGLAFLIHCGLLVPLPTNASAQEYPAMGERDWAWWRGPTAMGEADSRQEYPLEWDDEKNVLWRSDVPGRGHGSPILVADRIYIAVCDETSGSQGVLALDRETGKHLWKKNIHESGAMTKNAKSSGASSTIACDGKHLYIPFASAGKVVLSALTMDGEMAWQTVLCDYQVHQGFAASPLLYKNLVIVVADTKGNGAIAAYDRENGQMVWKRERPSNPNYPSAIVHRIADRDQLILIGCDEVISLEPSTGDTIWRREGATTECVTTTVSDGVHVYSSGGYPRNHLAAYRADRQGEIAWETTDRLYVPSLVIRNKHLYGVLDAGIAVCWDAATGKEAWKGRLGGDFSASPVLAGNRIYATSEAGKTYVYEATPERFRLLATNSLGDETFATPTFADGRIYFRIATSASGSRQEQIVCLGNSF